MTAAILRFNERTFVSLKRHRNYRLFFAGQAISIPGTWMQRVAQSWFVLVTLHQTPVAVGILAVCQFAPFTLFSMPAGVIVDRWDPRRTVIGTQAANMVLASAMAVVALSGVARAWHVYVIALLMGVVQSLDAPSRQSLTFSMVGKEELQNAVALNSSLFNASRIYGPALAGLLIAAVGAGWCFAFNAASFVAVLIGLLLMRAEEFHPVERHGRPQMLRGLREGLAFVRRQRVVLDVIALTFVVSTFGLNYNVLLPVLTHETLHAGSVVFGLLSAFFGAGALAGGLLAAGQRRTSMRLLLLGSGLFGTAELVLAPMHSVAVAALLLLASGVAFALWSSNSNSFVQLAAPDHLRGRMIGLYFFAFAGTGPFGGMLVGWLSARGGTRLAFTVAGSAVLLGTLVTAARRRSHARTDLSEAKRGQVQASPARGR